jgi:D-lyxose ketol-isomerase
VITERQARQAQQRALEMLSRAGVVLTEKEQHAIEVVDFGLGDLDSTGLEVVTFVNNERYCAKELVLFARQTCPEHRHPPVGADPGKQETLRCRWGTVYLYTEGESSSDVKARVPVDRSPYYTVLHQVQLQPGEHHTFPPNTLHWFQAGDEGAVIASFSSTSRDKGDIFTDPRVRRTPEIVPD